MWRTMHKCCFWKFSSDATLNAIIFSSHRFCIHRSLDRASCQGRGRMFVLGRLMNLQLLQHPITPVEWIQEFFLEFELFSLCLQKNRTQIESCSVPDISAISAAITEKFRNCLQMLQCYISTSFLWCLSALSELKEIYVGNFCWPLPCALLGLFRQVQS